MRLLGVIVVVPLCSASLVDFNRSPSYAVACWSCWSVPVPLDLWSGETKIEHGGVFWKERLERAAGNELLSGIHKDEVGKSVTNVGADTNKTSSVFLCVGKPGVGGMENNPIIPVEL